MSFITGAGATLAIGTTVAASTQAGFEADTYQSVGELETINEISRERTQVEFASLADARTRVKRGTEQVSVIEMTYAFDGTDAGQDALKDAYEVASQSADEFNFRVQLNDSLGVNPTTIYFRGPIMSVSLANIGTDEVVKRMAKVARNSDWIEVAAA